MSAGSILDLGDGKFTAVLRSEQPFLTENIKSEKSGSFCPSVGD
jgi:hypothetical protein